MLLQDRTIVITGIANEKSLSWGVAQSLYRQGAELVFLYRRDKSLRKLSRLLEREGIKALNMLYCDILDDDSVSAAFRNLQEQVGMVHGLVHSIAYADQEDLQRDFIQTTRDGFWLAHNASSYSLITLARHVKSMMGAGGSIVAQTYIGARKAVRPYKVMGPAKASLEASVRYLACDLGKDGIRVNAISSGPIRTSAASAITGLDAMLEQTKAVSPLGRTVDQSEVGDAAMFLLSPLSRGITGEIIHVDSGEHVLS